MAAPKCQWVTAAEGDSVTKKAPQIKPLVQ